MITERERDNRGLATREKLSRLTRNNAEKFSRRDVCVQVGAPNRVQRDVRNSLVRALGDGRHVEESNGRKIVDRRHERYRQVDLDELVVVQRNGEGERSRGKVNASMDFRIGSENPAGMKSEDVTADLQREDVGGDGEATARIERPRYCSVQNGDDVPDRDASDGHVGHD